MRPNGFVDIVPLARKDVVAATRVTVAERKSVVVAFDLKWTPNEVGRALRSGPVHDRLASPQHATATLLATADGWAVDSVK